ncbi:Os12g0576232 [Oryza sativa Japonica Group]|uniref:Os12g0576232 protein n=1 Tax=Oryza sativa subsp. japonica TaxID=39947 RepID=C7J9E2_ORYSJ|nr:hypothetical protein DAI22_12g186750 [Oryza sativa Japonica Group]BAH95749.1 Os12g0576232 [Oryza sativa Japonica Group]|eukprot:NP_001177021.1 Os12g0576232 [Oryza sativa Japonica Group]
MSGYKTTIGSFILVQSHLKFQLISVYKIRHGNTHFQFIQTRKHTPFSITPFNLYRNTHFQFIQTRKHTPFSITPFNLYRDKNIHLFQFIMGGNTHLLNLYRHENIHLFQSLLFNL